MTSSYREVRERAARLLGYDVPSHADVALTVHALMDRLEAAEQRLDDAAGLLAGHWPHPVFGCECQTAAELVNDDGQSPWLAVAWEQHVAALLRGGL